MDGRGGDVTTDLRTKLMQKRSSRTAKRKSQRSPLAFARELIAVSRATTRLTSFRLPYAIGRSIVVDPAIDGPVSQDRLLEVIGSALLEFIEELGPVYGKAGQIILSRLDPARQELAARMQLDRLYGQWPPLEFDAVVEILDREVPDWRKFLKRIDPAPIGVASISQVHAAVDHEGRDWVVKVIKPDSAVRMTATVSAIEQILAVIEPLAVTRAAQKMILEIKDLCRGYMGELSLRREFDTIQRVRAAMNDGRKQQLLRVPQVMEEISADSVLVIERFRGTILSEVVSGGVNLDANQKALLAKKVLQDLLVQVFELGLFHADPHAGNLMLLDDGTVGLFDWGLSGELLPSDRRHIAAVLRSIISLDFDGLVNALAQMAEDAGREVDRKAIVRELRGFMTTLQKRRASKKNPKGDSGDAGTNNDLNESKAAPSLNKLLDQCLRAADRLGIPVPPGLLMMAKTLVTVEGVARGIDPDIKLAYAATPVLLRVARPGIGDIFRLAAKLPSLMKQFSKAVAVATLGYTLISGGIGARAVAGVIVMGDSMATGAGAHPALQFDPQNIWGALNGKVDLRATSNHIPDAGFYAVTDPSDAALPTPLIAAKTPGDFRGPFSWVFSGMLRSVTRILSTPQYSWGYLIGRKFGVAPDQIVIAAREGAAISDGPAQARRGLDTLEAAARERNVKEEAEAEPTDPVRVFMMFGVGDICAVSPESVTPSSEFEASAAATFNVLLNHQQRKGADAAKILITVMQPLPFAQWIERPEILAKEIEAFGEKTTCGELQSRMFLPKSAVDVGDSPESRQIVIMSQILPPNPALLCASSYAVGLPLDQRITAAGNRLRAYREALASAVAKARKLADRSGLAGKVEFQLVEATSAIQFRAEDLAGDCFHLSPIGHEAIARAVVTAPEIQSN